MAASSSTGRRSKLADRVAEQDKLISKYEAKLTDLVKAYKTLTRERDTLSESLRAITSPPSVAQPSTSGPPDVAKDAEETTSGAEPEPGAPGSTAYLKYALASLTEEKRRMESEFKADRRRIIGERDKLEAELRARETELSEERKQRTREAEDAGMQIKHLQGALTERRAKGVLAGELPAAERLREMQTLTATQLRREQERATRAEEARIAAEDRLTGLEGELGTLARIIGEYERQRESDTTTIARLRDEARCLAAATTAPVVRRSSVTSSAAIDHSSCLFEIERLRIELEKAEALRSTSSSEVGELAPPPMLASPRHVLVETMP